MLPFRGGADVYKFTARGFQNLLRESRHAGTLLKGWLEASPSPSLDMPGGDVVDMLPVSLQV